MIPFPETVSDPKTILKNCRWVSKEGWTQVFILEDHCFDCAVCPSTSPFALGYLGKIVSRTTSYLEKDNRKGWSWIVGPYLIQLWRVCYVWKIVLSGWLFQILIVQFRLYLQPPWIVIIKTYTFTTGSKRVANSLFCELQGNVAVMNGSLGSEWFSAQVPPCSQSSSVILQNRSSNVLALYWRSDGSSALGYVRVINTNAVKNLQSNAWTWESLCIHHRGWKALKRKKRRTLQTWCQKNLQTLPKEQLAGKLTWCEPPGDHLANRWRDNVKRANPQNNGRAETATTVRLENLTLDTLRKLVDSIPHRLENVRKDKGRHSGY